MTRYHELYNHAVTLLVSRTVYFKLGRDKFMLTTKVIRAEHRASQKGLNNTWHKNVILSARIVCLCFFKNGSSVKWRAAKSNQDVEFSLLSKVWSGNNLDVTLYGKRTTVACELHTYRSTALIFHFSKANTHLAFSCDNHLCSVCELQVVISCCFCVRSKLVFPHKQNFLRSFLS